jgi:hypothetical protein
MLMGCGGDVEMDQPNPSPDWYIEDDVAVEKKTTIPPADASKIKAPATTPSKEDTPKTEESP